MAKKGKNKKEIYYTITPAGKELLEENYDKAEQNIAKLRNKNKLIKLSNELAKLI